MAAAARPAGPLGPADAALLHALQIAPRAPWARIGAVLGVDPVTASRRWERLRASGRAWITAHPGRRLQQRIAVAFVEIDCRPGRAGAVADALAALPRVATVEHMAGGRDLLSTVFAADLGELSALLLGHVSRLPGVAATRTRLATEIFGDGSRWRLRALSEAQRRHLRGRPPGPRLPDGPPAAPDAACRLLLPALSADGRSSVTRLAAATGLSASTVRRRLARMTERRDLALRCEVARDLTEWPVSATLWATVPAGHLEATARGLLTLAEVRLCASVTGPHNLLFTVWLRSVADVRRLEARLAERLPHLVLADRSVALRQTKLMGRLIGADGRAAGSVPLDPWDTGCGGRAAGRGPGAGAPDGGRTGAGRV